MWLCYVICSYQKLQSHNKHSGTNMIILKYSSTSDQSLVARTCINGPARAIMVRSMWCCYNHFLLIIDVGNTTKHLSVVIIPRKHTCGEVSDRSYKSYRSTYIFNKFPKTYKRICAVAISLNTLSKTFVVHFL